MHPIVPMPVAHLTMYNYALSLLHAILQGNAFAFTMLAALMQFGQAIYLNRIVSYHKLYIRPTYIPAYTYLLCTSIHPAFSYFSVTLVATWFVLWGFNLLLHANQTVNPRKQIFNAGFVFAIAALLQFSLVGYFLLLTLAVLILRSFNIGEWIVALLGYITPVYFFAGILFLADKFDLIREWPQIGLAIPKHIDHPVYFVGTIVGLLVLFICGWYATNAHMPKSSIYVRRNWLVVSLYLIISIPICIGTESQVQSGWLALIPALSLIIAHAFSMEKSKRFSNFTFYLSVILLIFCQFTLNK